MRLVLLFYFSLAYVAGSMAQTSETDMLLLKKKNNRTVQSYYTGTPISFITHNNQWVSGYIDKIRDDSVFIYYYDVRAAWSQFGMRKDTIGVIRVKYHYTDILAIPRKRKSWEFVKNGTLFMLGGGGYILLNVINGAYLDEPLSDKKNLTSLSIAGGVAATGFVLHKLRKPILPIGKKYRLDYMLLRK
ncbi:MAG TPA: hypothetical protein VIK74_06085 [Parasegetibacter sp.]